MIRLDKNIDSDLTKLYKSIIRKKGLVKTNTLVNSIKIELTLNKKGKCEIHINSVEYLQYVDEKYGITTDFINDRKFIKIIEEAYFELYEYLINKNGLDFKTPKTEIDLFYNY